jgi:hypothetical protein
MSQEQYADLLKYIPESDTVKMVAEYENMIDTTECNWEEAVEALVNRALNGDKEALFNLFELTYINGFNEGELAAAADYKGS